MAVTFASNLKRIYMKNREVLFYRIVTGIFSLMLVGGAITYFVDYDMVSEMFTSLGVPTEIIYPLAIAKILGVLAIWLIKNPIIKNLAYLGFAVDLVAAIGSHLIAGDGEFYGPILPLVLLIASYVLYQRNKAALS